MTKLSAGAARAASIAVLAGLGVQVEAQSPPAPPQPPPILYAPPPPMPPNAQRMPVDRARVVARPGPSLRHAIATELGEMPADGIALPIDCLVDRQSGRVARCDTWSSGLKHQWYVAAYRLGRAYRFELDAGLREATARPLITLIQERIVPADRRSTAFLARPPTPFDQIVLTRASTAEERARAFVPIAGVIRTMCEVRSDLSLFCVDPQPVGAPMDVPTLRLFQDAAFDLSAAMRVAPRLRNGAEAVGTVFALTIPFDGPPAEPSPRPATRREPFADLVPTDAEPVPFSETRVLMRPGAAVRHFLLQRRRMPPGATVINVRCEVDRPEGWIRFCDVPQPQGLNEITASWLAEHYRLLLDERARRGERRLAVVIPVRIDPADAAPPPMTWRAVQQSQVAFTRMPTAEELTGQYPAGIRPGTAARIRLHCEVQQDLSLFCIGPQVVDGELSAAVGRQFERAALQVTSLMRVAPTLRNGAAAPGAYFPLSIRFEPPEPEDGGNASSRDANGPTPRN